MEQRDIKIFQVLEAIEENPVQSQRELSSKLALSLGSVNKIIKDLTIQGLLESDKPVKIRPVYIITPKGASEKKKLRKKQLRHYISQYVEMKRIVKKRLSEINGFFRKRILLYGTGELCEIACMLSRENNFDNIKIIDDEQAGRTLNGFPVYKEAEMYKLSFDTILITGLENTNQARSRLIGKGIPSYKIFPIISQENIVKIQRSP